MRTNLIAQNLVDSLKVRPWPVLSVATGRFGSFLARRDWPLLAG